ncbi:hypothetical protein ES703_29265 [subsurface metagenome]
MPNIPADYPISRRRSVIAPLFTPSSYPITGDAIYHLPPPVSKAQHSYHRSYYISFATAIETAFRISNIHRPAVSNIPESRDIHLDTNTNYGGNNCSSRYIPSGL